MRRIISEGDDICFVTEGRIGIECAALFLRDLQKLTEKLAENVHDVWAKGRIAEGWTYGETKDNEKKTTPWLIPYADLPESEKNYDRNTALETVKTIMKLGFRFCKET